MKKFVKNSFLMIRHGESIWNHKSKFTGWTDIPLTENGFEEAKNIGNILEKLDLYPGFFFSSSLKRSIDTNDIIMRTLKMNCKNEENWRLNEKHYGYLDGIERNIIKQHFGEEYIELMRKSYTMHPPIYKNKKIIENHYYTTYTNMYFHLHPMGESKKMVMERFKPYWKETILPTIYSGITPLICTHKHTARVLMKHIKKISDKDFENYQLPSKKILYISLNDQGFIDEERHIPYDLFK